MRLRGARWRLPYVLMRGSQVIAVSGAHVGAERREAQAHCPWGAHARIQAFDDAVTPRICCAAAVSDTDTCSPRLFCASVQVLCRGSLGPTQHRLPSTPQCWSSNAEMLLTSSSDRTARLWAVGKADPVLRIESAEAGSQAFTHEVVSAQFLHMDRFIALAMGPSLHVFR